MQFFSLLLILLRASSSLKSLWFSGRNNGCVTQPITYARELILEKNLERLVTYHFEIPMTCEFQKCKNRNQGTSSCEVSVPQFFGHKIKISPILPKLVPNNTYSVQKLPTKL